MNAILLLACSIIPSAHAAPAAQADRILISTASNRAPGVAVSTAGGRVPAAAMGISTSGSGALAVPVKKPKASEPVVSSTPIAIIYPEEGRLIDIGSNTGMFILGSVSHPRRAFRINGSSVAVHPRGGFLAYLPVAPGTFTFRCELDLPSGQAVFTRTVVFSAVPAPLGPEPALILSYGLSPWADAELRPGDWVPLRFRGSPGGGAAFSVGGLKASPMAETKPGVYEGAYQLRAEDRFSGAEFSFQLKSPEGHTAKADAPGRLTALDRAPGVVSVRSEGIVNVRNAPGEGYILFPPPGTLFLATGRRDGELRLALSSHLSGWVDPKTVDWLPLGTPPPRAVLGTIRLSGEGESSFVTLDLTQKVPFQIEEAPDLSGVKLTLYSTVGHTNWIVHDSGDPFLEQASWTQAESDVVEVLIRLKPKAMLWGHDASWRGNSLRVELRRPPALAKAPASVFQGRTILIDPGHMPASPGAIGPRGTLESEVNYAIAKDLKALLSAQGAHALLSRAPEEKDVSLPERIRRAWLKKADLFVSVHNNALPDGENPFDSKHGFSIFYYHPHSLALADAVYRSYRRNLSLPGEGLRYGNLYVTRATQMPSILTESAYLMFPDQEELLRESAGRKRFARAMFEGLRDFLEAERKRQAEPQRRAESALPAGTRVPQAGGPK